MKNAKKFPAFLLTAMLCAGMMTMPVSAASLSQDGLDITLTTDKQEYSQDEEITATLTVTNTNDFAITNVSLEHMIPEGYKLEDGALAEKQLESLEAGETTNLAVTFVANTTDDNTPDNGNSTDNSNTPGNDNSNTNNSGQNNTNTGTGNSSQNSSSSKNSGSSSSTTVKTGDESKLAVWAVLFLAAICLSIALMALKKKKNIRLHSLFLCIVAASAVANSTNIETQAAENGTARNASIQEIITVDGNEVTLSAAVSYIYEEETPEVPSETITEFDESNIVLSFGAVSDVHINNSSTVSAERFANALTQLSAKAGENDTDGLDAVCVVGDLTDTIGNTEQIQSFIDTYESTLNVDEIPLIYTLGNHDISWGGSNELAQMAQFVSIFGDSYFENNLTDAEAAARGDYHFVINGYHFVCITPMTTQPITYAPESKQWLDATLAEITNENPNQFVYVLTHPMITNTCYGSEMNESGILGDFWATDDLTDLLSQYDQVVTFGGHLHFPINDERSIMQAAFTALGCGSVRYMAIENGGYEDMKSATVMNDNQSVSSGLLVQVDANGNMRVTRMNFMDGGSIKDNWEVQAPAADESHLTKYTRARGSEDNNTAPEMNGTAQVSLDNSLGGRYVSAELTFDAGSDDDMIHHYVITYGEVGSDDTTTKKILADFYLHNQVEDMKDSYTLDMGSLERGKTYNCSIYCVDSWDAQSNPVELTIEVPEGSDPVEAEALDDPYATLSLVDANLVDTKEKLTLANYSASFATETVTFQGITSEKETLHVAEAKQCYVGTFNEQATAADNTAFVNNGFSVEAFYVNRRPSGVQGVICGTQAGGWGLAENNGEPYFIIKFGSQYYSVYSGQTASNEELTHVIAVYDPEASEISIFINGEKMARTKVSGAYVVAAGNAFNSFCIGADVGPYRTCDSYFMTDFSMVSGNIYNYALSSGQVVTAYQNALASMS